MMTVTDQNKLVSDYLTSQGVTYTARLVGPTTRDEWSCDAWRVRFSRPVGIDGGGLATIETEYFTGTGHRKSARPMPADIARLGPRIIARVEWEQQNIKPVTPEPAGVIYSLLLDSGAAGETFASWCADFGYDTDSRKALATYRACQEIADQLNAFFNSAQRAELAAMLEDY